MHSIVTLESDGRDIVVQLGPSGSATCGVSTIQCTPTDSPGVYEAIVDGRSVPVVIWTDEIDTVQVSLRGYTYEARVLEERLHRYVAILQASPAARSRVVRISAPMPGLLKAVLTAEGAQVRKGDALFTLEAMKMENVIKSPINGIVHNLTTVDGTAVEKGVLLCVVEPTH